MVVRDKLLVVVIASSTSPNQNSSAHFGLAAGDAAASGDPDAVGAADACGVGV
jgi:hypothetical protein